MNPAPLIAHVSDLHLGAENPVAAATLAADVAAAGPALTVVTGDSTMRARPSQFRRARDLLDRLPRPLLVVTGNHDLPLLNPARLSDPYGRYRRWIAEDLNPVVRAPGVVALGLQSMPRWRWKNGRVSARQAAEVARVLGAAPADAVRVLALHHPPLGSGWLIGVRGLLGAVGRARVDVVLAGHTHIPDVRSHALPGGAGHRTAMVTAGTAASRRTRGCEPSWSSILLDGDRVVVQERFLTARGWCAGRTVCCPRRS